MTSKIKRSVIRHYNKKESIPEVDVCIQILNGFAAVVGIAAVAIAFTANHSATRDSLAAIGIGLSFLGGIKFFKGLPPPGQVAHEPLVRKTP